VKRTTDRSAGTTGEVERAHEMLDALNVPAGSLAERIAEYLDVEVLASGVVRHRSRFAERGPCGMSPASCGQLNGRGCSCTFYSHAVRGGGGPIAMAVMTRPQDWAEPARTILFGAQAERRRA
jgi:hypothetical protein